jgi:hypothetical protein
MARPSPLRLAFLIALLCAVSLRLLTPPGWMPNLDGHAGGPLVICTGDGARTTSPAGSDAGHPLRKAAGEVCAFAGLALSAPPQPLAVAPTQEPAPAAARPLRADQIRFAPAWRRAQSPRAPPLHA